MKKQTKPALFWIGIFLLLIPGLLHAYLLMPFPGSQDLEAINFSYYLEKIVNPLRIFGAVLIAWYFINYYSKNSLGAKLFRAMVLLLCVLSFYFTDVHYKAESMFEEPKTIRFANVMDNKVPLNTVIIGVVNQGVAKAYPLIYLGYHHKIQDNVGTEPVLVTYCTMCRSGRVYSPIINGVRQNFRLVGARHYNAIVEDAGTKTWWYQATGVAAAGKLKGEHLQELPYEQSSLSAWLNKYPGSLILQPDTHYLNDYKDLKNYDRVQAVDKDSTIKNKDSLMAKSWVLGVMAGQQAKAYNWRNLVKKRLLNDEFNKTPVLITIEKDSASFHAFASTLNLRALHFKLDSAGKISDMETASVWNWEGIATEGPLKGLRLRKLPAYQEYWRSWSHFHPGTLYWNE